MLLIILLILIQFSEQILLYIGPCHLWYCLILMHLAEQVFSIYWAILLIILRILIHIAEQILLHIAELIFCTIESLQLLLNTEPWCSTDIAYFWCTVLSKYCLILGHVTNQIFRIVSHIVEQILLILSQNAEQILIILGQIAEQTL